MNNPPMSIVIPCFNQGRFIDEALQSLEECNQDLFEIVIVNDGSTDEFTNQRLTALKEQGLNVIFQENKGLGAARNSGIAKSRGRFILPLDADNRIYPEYVSESITVLD